MIESRTRNSSRNILFGIILKIYQIVIPFLMRTAMIYFMGVQYLGLNSLFTSILQVLNLAELGVGSAMVYSMYKPIVEKDKLSICALLKLYKSYYMVIGIIIAIIGIATTPFIPKLINGDVPSSINVYILYLMNLAATVISYFLYSYKGSLLQAHQRIDVISKITIVTNTIQYSIQIIVLWKLKNYYMYVLVSLLTQTLTNLLVAVAAKKMYPDYQPEGRLDKDSVKEINQRIRDLFTSKIATVVVGSADTIVISAFLGLTILAVYQNYYYILSSVYGMICVVLNAVMASIGNSLVTESVEKNYNDLKKFTFILCWLINVCSCLFAVLYQPFMEIWVGEKLMLDDSYVIVLIIYFYVMTLSMVWATIKDAAGLWRSDKYRTLIGASFNLILNLILVRYIGLYGVIISTILSYILISMPWLVNNLFRLLYKMPMKRYVVSLLSYIVICIISCVSCIIICSLYKFTVWVQLGLNFLIAMIIPNALQLIIYRNKKEFQDSFALVKNILKGGA